MKEDHETKLIDNAEKELSARSIAKKLLIDVRTIKHRIENIKAELNAENKYYLIEIYHSSL